MLGGPSAGVLMPAATSKYPGRCEIRELLIDGIKQLVGDAPDGKSGAPPQRFVFGRWKGALGNVHCLGELADGLFSRADTCLAVALSIVVRRTICR